MDQDRFFYEATLKICSSQKPEKFLFESFRFLKKTIKLPADYACIVYVSSDLAHLHILALTSEEQGIFYRDQVGIPPEKQALLLDKSAERQIVISDALEDHPIGGLWARKGYDAASAQLSMRLDISASRSAALNFLSFKKNSFTDYHAQQILRLKAPFSIAVSNAIRLREFNDLKEGWRENNRFLTQELKAVPDTLIVGADQGLKQVMGMIEKVAPLSSPVLLLGETGTGKEVIAGAIHRMSERSWGPFIKVNCGAIPENLADSELFGHEKGAFTGAFSTRKGRFELADKGTLFLDEVGELSLDIQVKLLRAIQEQEIERVGGSGPVPVNIRIIAATHRNLADLIKRNKFREDLFFRLNVFPVTIPALRDRKSDILALAQYFIRKKCMEMGMDQIPHLSAEIHARLLSYPWPGNIRELENVIERSIILGRGQYLDVNWLTLPASAVQNAHAGQSQTYRSEKQNTLIPQAQELCLDTIVKEHIQKVVALANGKISGPNGAAQMLNINPSTLRNRIKKLGIRV